MELYPTHGTPTPTDKHPSAAGSPGYPALAARRRTEREREKVQRQRARRIQAANDAVETYLKAGGARDYPTAFLHVQRTRPELFADMRPSPCGVTAGNYNHHHDELGRFASGEGGEGGSGGDSRQPKTPSIRAHPHPNADGATCVVSAILSVAETTRDGAGGGGPAPSDAGVRKQLSDAAGQNINWRRGISTDDTEAGAKKYAEIVQAALAQNGVQSDAKLGYTSAKDMAADLIDSGMPAIINARGSDRGGSVDEHAVSAQWDPDSGSFLVNNLGSEGGTSSHSRQEFENGELRVDSGSPGNRRSGYRSINLQRGAIIARKP